MEGIKRFDVVFVDFGMDVVGSEQCGRRPALIVQNDLGNSKSATTIVMPLTTNIKKNPHQPTHMILKKNKENGLTKDSMILGECVRQVSNQRILGYIGKITSRQEQMNIKKIYLANFGA